MRIRIIISILMVVIMQFPVIAKENSTQEVNTIEYMNISWWEKYNDEHLINNLLKIYQNNYDLKIAALKVKENEQIVKAQFANELPKLGLSGQLYRDLRSSMQQFGDMQIPSYAQYNYYLPITASYEVDIWGTNRLRTKSSKQELEIVKQAERATYIALTSDFATDYFNLIRTDEFLKIQNELIKLQEEIVSKIKDKYEVGLCSVNDLLVEQRVLTLLNEERNTYIKNRDTLIDTIKVYLADSSDTVERNSYERITLLNGIPLEYSTEVIENRPDYLQEEANLKRIGIDIKVARRNFLPKFIIFGQIGLNAYHLDTLFNSASQMFSAGVLPSIDLFSGGRKLAILRLKKFQYDEAFNSYKKTIIDGIKDLNLGIIKYKEAQENYKESSKRLELQDKTYSLVKDKLEIGSASDLDVLYAKQAYLMVKKDEVSNKMNSVISTIGLYKAAGGMDLYKINEDL